MKTSQKRILLLGATLSSDNMGIGALAAGALKVLCQRFPDANISLLDYGNEPSVSLLDVEGRRISVSLINLRFSWRLYLPNNIAVLLAYAVLMKIVGRGVANVLFRRNQWLRAVYESDLAVAVSGGDSFSDIYGLGRFFYVVLPQLLVAALGVRLILLPQTVGPFRGHISRRIAKVVMIHADAVYSRDQEGVGYARSILGPECEQSRTRFSYDLGFILEPHKPSYLDIEGFDAGAARSRPLVGLNISGLLLMGGYDRRNMFGLRGNYASLIEQIVHLFIVDLETNVLLVPHVFGMDEESDVRAVKCVFERLENTYAGRLYRVTGDYDQSEIKYVIGLCDFFVGARMHACIAALSQAIPAVAIAYSRKFAGVLESVGAGQLVADARSLSNEEILLVLKRTFADREVLHAQLQLMMIDVRTAVFRMLAGVDLQ